MRMGIPFLPSIVLGEEQWDSNVPADIATAAVDDVFIKFLLEICFSMNTEL